MANLLPESAEYLYLRELGRSSQENTSCGNIGDTNGKSIEERREREPSFDSVSSFFETPPSYLLSGKTSLQSNNSSNLLGDFQGLSSLEGSSFWSERQERALSRMSSTSNASSLDNFNSSNSGFEPPSLLNLPPGLPYFSNSIDLRRLHSSSTSLCESIFDNNHHPATSHLQPPPPSNPHHNPVSSSYLPRPASAPILDHYLSPRTSNIMTLSNNGNHSGSSTLLNQMSDLDFRRGIARDRSRGPTPPPPPPGYPHSSSSSSYRPQPPPPQQQNQQFVASGSSSQMAQRHTPYQSQSHHSQGFRGPPQRSSLHPPPRRHHDASSSFSSSSPSPYSPRRMDSVSLEDVISHACVDILQEAGQHSLKAVELANTLRARVGTEPLGRVRELWGGLLALLEMHPRLFKVERIPKNDVVSLAIPGGESSQQVDLPTRNPSSQHGEEVKTEEPSSSSSSSLSQGESNNNNTASSRCLHVSSLLPTIVEADIMNAFGVFGDIEDITMVSQRSRRFTFVRFKRIEDAIHAKEQLSGSYPWLNCISFAHHEEPNANILSLPTSSSSPSSSSNIASLSPSKHTHTPIQRSYYAQQSRPQQSFQETSSAPWSKQPLQQEEYGSSQLRFSKSVLSVLTDDTYVPTQSWQCSPTSDAPFIQAVITQLQILGGVATISKLRGLLKSRIQSVVNIKSVPLKALLAAYPRYFTLTSNLAELKPEFMASQPNNAMYHHPLANIRGGSF